MAITAAGKNLCKIKHQEFNPLDQGEFPHTDRYGRIRLMGEQYNRLLNHDDMT